MSFLGFFYSIFTARWHNFSRLLLLLHTHKHNLCRYILNIEAFSSTLLYEICRFVSQLLVQEVWSVSAIRNQQDVILQKNTDDNTKQKHTHSHEILVCCFGCKKTNEGKMFVFKAIKCIFLLNLIRKW